MCLEAKRISPKEWASGTSQQQQLTMALHIFTATFFFLPFGHVVFFFFSSSMWEGGPRIFLNNQEWALSYNRLRTPGVQFYNSQVNNHITVTNRSTA